MRIEELKITDSIEIVDVSKIKQGEYLWENGDIVEIKSVDIYENRIEVWNKEKYLSELIYGYELEGIRKF